MQSKSHWEQIYRARPADALSWYEPHLVRALDCVRRTGLGPLAAILDVGGGESTLVDDLLAAGYRDLTVLDLSERALEVARARLGDSANTVHWMAGDILDATLPAARFDIWHDRAVFHFLTDEPERRRYVAQAVHALRAGGYVVISTFGPQGPDRCSGLEVCRYSPEQLDARFGPPFERLASSVDEHVTPSGGRQQFVCCLYRRTTG